MFQTWISEIKCSRHKSKGNGSLVTAWKTSSGFLDFVFHVGYQGFEFPRSIRRLFAKSAIHRSWFSGFTGLGILSITELMQAHDLDEEINF